MTVSELISSLAKIQVYHGPDVDVFYECKNGLHEVEIVIFDEGDSRPDKIVLSEEIGSVNSQR